MSRIYNKMRIDVKEEITDIITAKQNDSGSRFLDVYLYDGSTPIDLTGHEVRIYMRKPDGTEIFNNGEITDATAGRCQFELTDQALGAVGKLLCEISIWKDNVEILTTQTFDIFVTESLRSDGSIESSNEYGALVVLYQNLYEAIDLMQTMVEQFGQPGEVATQADINTFWRMLEYLYSVNDNALKNASVSEVLERMGLNTDGEGSGTLFGAVNPLAGLIANKIAVKSVQSGIVPSQTTKSGADNLKLYGSQEYAYYIDITISAVSNIDKCQVSVETFRLAATSSANNEANCIGKLVSNDKLRVYYYSYTNSTAATTNNTAFKWEVVEFA